ncbi:hypothetical protein AAG906_040759 [Vitis piasezkii]
MSVANIGSLGEIPQQEGCEILQQRTTFSQPKADFAAVQNFPSTWSDRLPMVISLCFPSLHSGFAYGKGLQNCGSSCFELSIALAWIPKNSPQSRIALVIKLLTKTLIRNDCKAAPSPTNNSTCMARYLAMVKEGLKKLDEWIIKCIPQ